MEFDVVVVGSGAAGLTAAVVAAQAGLEVLVLEKSRYFGGTSAISAGGLWMPAHPHMKGAGREDSKIKGETYLRALIGNLYDADMIDAYLENAPRMVAYMGQHTELELVPAELPDYESHLPGATTGRTLLNTEYDGTRLGPYLQKLRPVLPQMSLFGSMQVGFADIPSLMAVTRDPGAFFYSARLFVRYLIDRMRHGRGTRLANGNALVARLLYSALESGVTLWENAPMWNLLVEEGAVTGVEAEKDEKPTIIQARAGVVLASGGFGANSKMRNEHMPMADQGWSLQPESNEGDGIRFGIDAGARFRSDNAANGIWAPMSSMVEKDGTRTVYPHLYFDRHSPGSLAVDESGRRFVNEASNYQAFVNTMHGKGVARAFLISDHPAVRKYGLGLARPAPLPIGSFIRNGYLTRASSVRELAGKLGLDPLTLEETVARFNVFARAGVDEEFARGSDAYSAAIAMSDHKPNPSLAPLETGPFYAVELRPGDLSSLCGLETNATAQVLNCEGAPIPGLFAAGLDMNSIFRGTYPGGGASLGPAMTFGYIAAREIARQAKAGPKAQGSADPA